MARTTAWHRTAVLGERFGGTNWIAAELSAAMFGAADFPPPSFYILVNSLYRHQHVRPRRSPYSCELSRRNHTASNKVELAPPCPGRAHQRRHCSAPFAVGRGQETHRRCKQTLRLHRANSLQGRQGEPPCCLHEGNTRRSPVWFLACRLPDS